MSETFEKPKRGFAAIDPAYHRELASRGGKASHAKGDAHEFTSEEAAEAGRKGGKKLSENREHMAEIGRKGGLAVSRGKLGGEAPAADK